MPSGKTHKRVNISIWTILLGYSLIYGMYGRVKWFLIGFIFGTYFMTPDLDLEGSAPDQNWGAFHVVWNVYAKKFKHRQRSHSLILGTPLRMIYLIAVSISIYLAYSFLIVENVNYDIFVNVYNFIIIQHQNQSWQFFLGIYVSDLIHLILDELF